MSVASSTSFMPGAKTVPLRVPEIVIDGSRGQNEIVIGHAAVAGMDVLRVQVDVVDLAQHDRGIGLVRRMVRIGCAMSAGASAAEATWYSSGWKR